MEIKYFIRTTGERVLDESIHRELGDSYTLLVDYEHNSGKAYLKQLLIINDYASVFMEDDIILCKDFKNRIEKVINEYPDKIINFFTFPTTYMTTQFQNFHCYNQCCYFPKGLPKKLHDTITEQKIFHRRQEVMLREALFRMKIKTLVYRPCLVQHIDNGSLMGYTPSFSRRTPYFIDYLDELGITYKEARLGENKNRLTELLREKFKEVDGK